MHRPGPFQHAGDERGVLCVHGFTGTPFEMSYLGPKLAERGMTVVAPCLPGHDTHPSDLASTSWTDWYGEVERGFDSLVARCSRVAVVGQSLGGLLALHLACRRPEQVLAVASLATPLWMPALATQVERLARRFPRFEQAVPMLPKLGGIDVRDRRARAEAPSYRVVPMAALHHFFDFMRMVRAELAEVRAPLLIVHAHQDHTAPFACSLELAQRVSSRIVRRRELSQSFHLIAVDVERSVVEAEVGTFLEAQFSAAAGGQERCVM